MTEKIIIAGSGGQGNLFIGDILCLAAMLEGKNVTWLPSYGPQMRGGTATCEVVISDNEIGSPVIAHPDALIVMNKPSLAFIDKVKPGSVVIVNQSLASYEGNRSDIILVPVADLMKEIANPKLANMVLLGVYLKKRNSVKLESVLEVLKEKMSKKSGWEELFELNKKALMIGYNFVE